MLLCPWSLPVCFHPLNIGRTISPSPRCVSEEHTTATATASCFPSPAACISQGVAVIAAGQMLQGHSHLLLASLAAGPPPGTHAPDTSDMPAAARSPPLAAESPLRRRGPAAPDVGSATGGPPAPLAEGSGAGQYAVPRGGAFEWVSCPHYLAEIVIYSGFCVAQRVTPLAALVLTWVVRNLRVGVPVAISMPV